MRILFTACLILTITISLAQDGKYQLGASNAAFAGASSTNSDPWCLFNNIGALGRINNASAILAYQNRFNIPSFQVVGAGLIYPTKISTIGSSFYRFGDETYNQQRVNLSIGNQLQMVSLGAGINLIQFHVEGLETKNRIVFELGGLVELTPQIFLGAHIFNIQENSLIPAVMKAGLSYRPSKELMLNVETQKELGFRDTFKAGLQYQIISRLYLRTGFCTAPLKSAFGFGLHINKFVFDYAFTANPSLGGINDISLTIPIAK
jgi:hypothetical protein